jgi:SAM-dependent methyltransferase
MNDWETYWEGIKKTGDEGQVFWDDASESASAEDLHRFINYMDPALPLLDLGCGNGRKARFFARHFRKVIGADVSLSAIRLAELETIDERNVEYRVFDALDATNAIALHQEFGDLNIYMRGVLHVIERPDRGKFVSNLEILLGGKGVLYQVEASPKFMLEVLSMPVEVVMSLPKVWHVGFKIEERARVYPDDRWIVIDEGRDIAISTIPLADGNKATMPGNYLLLRKRDLNGPGLSEPSHIQIKQGLHE